VIILDTNVISEPLRSRPGAGVIAWLDAQVVETLYLTTISLAEMRYGIACLPDGRRRQRLHDRFEGEFVPLFHGRILAFDEPATTAYAALRARARMRGVASVTSTH
jgi:toxin FitB